jgi:alpha-D-xyloside xylohydrolase
MLKLRYRLLPYLYATAWQVTNQDASFMRPLLFDYPDDKALLNLTDQYLFGSSLMVAPVLKAQYVKAADNSYTETFDQPGSRQVYLPANSRWIDFWTGETLEGGQTVTKATPIDLIPLYVKAGSILPWGPDVQYATEKNWKTLEIRIYPGADGQFTLYEDENDSYNYEKGAHSTITFNWNEATRTLTLSNREGKFKGMHKKRHFNIVLVQPSTNPADAGAASIAQTITYKGKAKTIVL